MIFLDSIPVLDVQCMLKIMVIDSDLCESRAIRRMLEEKQRDLKDHCDVQGLDEGSEEGASATFLVA